MELEDIAYWVIRYGSNLDPNSTMRISLGVLNLQYKNISLALRKTE
jgi:hypothetical protein